MNQLACFGGQRLIEFAFEKYNSFGRAEISAAKKVVASGILSQFVGEWSSSFYGGHYVQSFERAWAEYFGVKHAISVNSWTSGLIACVGAVNIQPGDEVILPPWTMSATVAAILHWNAIPVFADIEPDYFCIDPICIENKVTERTRAIIAVDIFGQSCNIEAINIIARKYNLKVITDSAQSPGAIVDEKFTGTLGDIGGFSLNYHKHIHTGEGGVIVTNDDELAKKCRFIRNHAESSIVGSDEACLSNMLGHNFRLGEIEAAIGLEQLKKLRRQVSSRQLVAKRLTKGLQGLKGLKLPKVRPKSTNVYYVYGCQLDLEELGVTRSQLIHALKCEGVQGLEEGYTNLHQLPMFQKLICYGSSGFPWRSDICQFIPDYSYGTLPVAEKLHDETYFGLELCNYKFSLNEINATIGAFKKVWQNIDELKRLS